MAATHHLLLISCNISRQKHKSPIIKKSLNLSPILKPPSKSKSYCSSSNSASSSSSSAVVISSKDEKYGQKQIISVTPQLYDYILSNVREPQILRKLREETATMQGSQMQVSPDQAQLLAMLVQMLGAQRCIEVGVYTGYSSLAVALALPESGRLVACERDARSLEIARKYYELAGVSHKKLQLKNNKSATERSYLPILSVNLASNIEDDLSSSSTTALLWTYFMDVRHGLAMDTLKWLILNGEACSYDFAFVDAEKRMYSEYFELLLQLMRVGGVIVIDNVLWHGRVSDPLVNDPKTVSIRKFNKNLMQDKRVSISMVPIGDGMTICRKR